MSTLCTLFAVTLTHAQDEVLYGNAATDSDNQNENEGLARRHHQTPRYRTPNSYSPAPRSEIGLVPTEYRARPHQNLFASDDIVDDIPSPDPQQQCLSRSTSIQPGEKRPRSDDSDLETEEVVHKAQRINEKSGRPKAGDYDDVAKEVILQAATTYRCLLSTENGFPELAVETELVKLAWEDANKESGMATLALTPDIAKIVSHLQ